MKLFYILILTALMGLFGIGGSCNGNGNNAVEEGDPEPGTTPEINSFTVVSRVRTGVEVKHGDLSVELKSENKCIEVSREQVAGLQISTSWFGKPQVLCGPSSEDGSVKPCEAKNVTVEAGDQDADGDGNADSATLVDNPNSLGCSAKLVEPASDGAGDGGTPPPAGDGGAGDGGTPPPAGDGGAGDGGTPPPAGDGGGNGGS